MQNHQLVNQNSGNKEYYSPRPLVEAACATMGGIDLDPASSERANTHIVKASKFYSRPAYLTVGFSPDLIEGDPIRNYVDKGGLSHKWHGRVWMNHPFGSSERACKPNCDLKRCKKRGWHSATDLPGNKEWIAHVVAEYEAGRIEQACILTYMSFSETWFKPLKPYPVCLINGRVNYLDPETLEPIDGATKGSCVTYLGSRVQEFADEFSRFGEVKVTLRPSTNLVVRDNCVVKGR